MNNKTITGHQLFTLTALSILGGSILVISSTIAAVAKRDAWISVLVTILFGLFMLWIYSFLGTRHQGLTLIGITQKIFGSWLGKIVSAGYVLFLFTTAYGIPWYIGSFGAHNMPGTPVPVILVIFVAVLLIAIYYGIEAIARASEVLYIFVTLIFLLSIVLVLPNIKTEYITPVLENGFVPIIKGAVLLSCFITFVGIVMLMIYPSHVADSKEGQRALFKGFLWVGGIVFSTTLVSILVLGSVVVAKSAFPTVLLAREVNIGTVLTRLEYAISVIWTVTEFTIGITFFYTFIIGLSELIGLKDHKRIAAPLGLIILEYAWIVNPDSVQHANWIIIGFMPQIILFGCVIPVLMLVIYLLKQLTSKKSASNTKDSRQGKYFL